MRMISILSILGLVNSNDESPVSGNELGGSGAVASALNSRAYDDVTPAIRFGEPRLVDRGAGPISDLHVVVPTSTETDSSDPANVEFELPEDPENEDAELNQFVAEVGVESVEDVEGVTVDSIRERGVLLPDASSVEFADVVAE